VRETLTGFGYQVTINDPYKGAELVRAYSDPAAGRHSLQIEIKRALYMDEAAIRPHAGFDELRANLTRLIEVIRDYAVSKAARRRSG
jgi:N-formylglutamate amidohydrolase